MSISFYEKYFCLLAICIWLVACGGESKSLDVFDRKAVEGGTQTITNVYVANDNQAPLANAGADQTIVAGNAARVIGSASTDSDGRIVSYRWTKNDTLVSTLSEFILVDMSVGSHVLNLKVTDDQGATSVDTVTVFVSYEAPVANAGKDRLLYFGERLVLDASASDDGDGVIVFYEWRIDDWLIGTENPLIEQYLEIGIHDIDLTVTDEFGLQSSDTVTVYIQNNLPIADAGPDIWIKSGDQAIFSARNSVDTDGVIVSYLWTWRNRGSYLGTGINFDASLLPAGVHTICLWVTDDQGGSSRDCAKLVVSGSSTELHLIASAAGNKIIRFSWPEIPDATYYRLLALSHFGTGYTVVPGNEYITDTSTSIEIPVHLTDWIQSSYLLEAYSDHEVLNKYNELDFKLQTSNYVRIYDLMLSSVGYLSAEYPDRGDSFGFSVAVSEDGNTLAVGAPFQDSNAEERLAVDRGARDNSARDSGAVYVYRRMGERWLEQGVIKASNASAGDQFGSRVSLSDDGNTLAVAAIRESSNAKGVSSDGSGEVDDSATLAGAVYVFGRSNTGWAQQAYVKASNTDAEDGFGFSISLSGDGNTLAVAAVGESSDGSGEQDNSIRHAGAVYVYCRSDALWRQQAYLKATESMAANEFGSSLSLSAAGNTLAVGAAFNPVLDAQEQLIAGAGAVYVYSRNDVTWSSPAYVTASSAGAYHHFGISVSLSADGKTLAVGANKENSETNSVSYPARNNNFHYDNANPGLELGAAYVFVRSGPDWVEQMFIKATNGQSGDLFGSQLSLSSDGNILAVGAYGEDGNASGVERYLSGRRFGYGINDNSVAQSGAVYVYRRKGGLWGNDVYIKPTYSQANSLFGISVALANEGQTLVVGASGQDNKSRGGRDRADPKGGMHSGAVYLY